MDILKALSLCSLPLLLSRKGSDYVIFFRCRIAPEAPWETSPVGSPRRKVDGTPLRYGGFGGDTAPAKNHMFSKIADRG